MEELKSAISWFEIPATDFDRAVRFYDHFAIIDDTEGNRIYLHSMN